MGNSAEVIHIRSAHDIVAALQSPVLTTRLAVLQAIASNPVHVAAYGAAAGVDLIAVLLVEATRRDSLLYRKAVMGALVNFDEPRVVEIFRSVLDNSSDSDLLRLAAKRVALDTSTENRQFLREKLLNESSPLRIRCIAWALVDLPRLSDAERLRMSLVGIQKVTTEGVPWPRVSPEMAQAWSQELTGPFALHARQLLQSEGTPADLLALLPLWRQWPQADQAWLLSWGSALFRASEVPAPIRAILPHALDSGDKQLRLAALGWCSLQGAALPVDALRFLARDPDAELRYAALLAMPIDSVDWWQIAKVDASADVRALAVERAVSRTGSAEGLRPLTELVEDADWQVRAAIVRALNALGSDACETAFGWLASNKAPVRASALQVLLDQRQEHRLIEDLMG